MNGPSPHPRKADWFGKARLGLAAMVLVLVPACSGPGDRGIIEAFELVPTQVFRGDADEDALLGRVHCQVPCGSALLSQVQGLVEGPDSLLHVLDRDWSKVVTFSAHGGVERVFELARGEGPGELMQPWHLSLSAGGDLVVLDRSLGRLLFLSPTGHVLDQVSLEPPMVVGVVVDGEGTIWGQIPASPQRESAVLTYSPDGRPKGFRVERTRRDRASGPPADIVGTPNGRILVAHSQPSVWTEVQGDLEFRRGVDAFPDSAEIRVPVPGYPDAFRVRRPVRTVGIGQLSDGRVLVYYLLNDLGPPDTSLHVDVFSEAGAYLGTAALPDSIPDLGRVFWTMRLWHVGPWSDRVFIPGLIGGIEPAIVAFEIQG